MSVKKPVPKLLCSCQGPPECSPPGDQDDGQLDMVMVMKMFGDNKYDDDDDDNDDDDDDDDEEDLSHLALEVVNMSSQHRV